MPITPPIPPEPPPLYSFTSGLIVFNSSPNLKRAKELIKHWKIELPPKCGSCSDVKSGTDIIRSMIRDTPSSNKLFSVPVFFQKSCHVEAFLISLGLRTRSVLHFLAVKLLLLDNY